ncbi:putative cytochrome P450 [Rosellinia necatrix]|uniref:Putative cytochrome P450 n=1 Tax=Rosellinia necatrix TaxID=77044 RepID=A0A1S8A8T3_ROSNE|nr:putative cytochrome P450 [Rosellinia necatrix]
MILSGFQFELSAVPLITFAALVLWYTVSSFFTWYRLRHVPGPLLASFSYLWMIRNTLTLTQGGRLEALHEKYGPLVRVAPNHLVTNDPALLRRVLGVRSAYKRTTWYDCFKADGHDTMASMLDTRAHDSMKAKLTSGYHGRDNTELEAGIDGEVQHLVDVIRARHLETPAEFSGLTRRFTLDSLTLLAFGQRFGFLEAEGDLYDYFRSMDGFAVLVTLVADVPYIARLAGSPLLAPFRPRDTDASGLGKVLGLAHENVAARYRADGAQQQQQQQQQKGTDIMSSFMRYGLSQRESEAETMVLLLAGADNNAILLQTAMLYVLSSPRVYQRLKDEVRQAVVSGEASSPITFEQAKKLPYLQVCISFLQPHTERGQAALQSVIGHHIFILWCTPHSSVLLGAAITWAKLISIRLSFGSLFASNPRLSTGITRKSRRVATLFVACSFLKAPASAATMCLCRSARRSSVRMLTFSDRSAS